MSLDNILLIPGLGAVNLQSLLFGAGEVGGLYDWSDRSTMFQDHLGTTPITASGQTRGLHLDKSKGLVRGSELVVNGTFDTDATGWTSILVTPTVTGGQVSVASTSSGGRLQQEVSGVTAGWYEVKFDIISVASPTTSVRFGTSSGGSDLGVFALGVGSHTARIFVPGTSLYVGLFPSVIGTSVFDNISVRELPGHHRYQANASSRPQYIEDETGHYGLYDGVDDWDETNAVDFTGTNKMTVWWGGRKLAEASQGTAVEFSDNSSTTQGTFAVFAPSSTSQPNYQFRSYGTTLRTLLSSSDFAAPISNVLTMVCDIAAPLLEGRINGSVNASVTSSQGTGNYGNHKLYFGRRGGTSFPANIREYMTIIRGAETPLATIETVEREVRRKIKGLTW